MTIQTQSALLAAIISFFVGIGVLVAGRRTRTAVYFALLGTVLAGWNLAEFLAALTQSELWTRVGTVVALLIPICAIKFFQYFLAGEGRLPERTSRVTGVVTLALLPVVFSPLWKHPIFGVVLLGWVYVNLYMCIVFVWIELRNPKRRVDAPRLKYIGIGGLIAITFSLVDQVPRLDVSWSWLENAPVVGNIFMVIFLYFVSQMIVQFRLLDIRELIAKLAVLTSLIALLAAIYGVLSIWIDTEPGLFYFNTIIASFVILILFEPLRNSVEDGVNRMLFAERFEFARQLSLIRTELQAALELDELVDILLTRLEQSRRVTHAAFYLLDDDGQHWDLAGKIGTADLPTRLGSPVHWAALTVIQQRRHAVLESLQEELEQLRALEEEAAEQAAADVKLAVDFLETLGVSVCIPVISRQRVIGLLVMADARIRDAYSPEEVRSLVQIATQAAISIENSKVVAQLRERDRLAALGEMAAGLAHEIRNPLSAIKGAVQVLELALPPDESERQGGVEDDDVDDDEKPEVFLDIIVEEANRLNNVVSQFLDYARPYRGDPGPCEVNRILTRVLSLTQAEAERWSVAVELELADELPAAYADDELLMQVCLNLALNAVQATGRPPESPDDQGAATWSSVEDGALPHDHKPHVVMGTRLARRNQPVSRHQISDDVVEIWIEDNGTGMSEEVQQNLFIPFYTTKQHGTGLGLAISQRIVENLGGRLEFVSDPGRGTTFRVFLLRAADRQLLNRESAPLSLRPPSKDSSS